MTKQVITIPIILFKTPCPTTTSDSYHLMLSQQYSALSFSYQPRFISVLTETHVITDLVPVIENGPDRWDGIIVTSKRGVEGWVRGVEVFLDEKGKGKGKEGGWDQVPFFSVGQASTEYLSSADIHSSYKPRPVSHMFDDPPKSAGSLCELVLGTSPRNRKKGFQNQGSYLFLCGDKALDEMPTTLKGRGRHVKEVVVYKTSARKDVRQQLESIEKQISKGWLAFFSPSSAAVVLPFIREYRHLWEGWKIFAIGETTKRYLEDEAGLRVHAVADKPNPEGMLAAVKIVDEKSLGESPNQSE
nr:hypothetical protein L204_00738 [Cryptococcus depauperatus CBS 7855]